jgi:hypothetical protein
MMRAYLIVGAAVSTVVILAVDNVVRLWGVPGSTAAILVHNLDAIAWGLLIYECSGCCDGASGAAYVRRESHRDCPGPLWLQRSIDRNGRGVRGRAAVVPRNALSCRRNGQGTVPLSASRPSHVRTS